MAYTTNPHAAKARGDAVRLVKIHSWSKAKTARYFGVSTEGSTLLQTLLQKNKKTKMLKRIALLKLFFCDYFSKPPRLYVNILYYFIKIKYYFKN